VGCRYRLFQKAAEGGNDEALYEIARMYSTGDYGKRLLRQQTGDREVPDLLGAYNFYKLAAEKGYAPAQLALGLIYFFTSRVKFFY
jgi:TPR repeat protein